ncbi:MAG TPA: cupin domain-containing protein [Stackebrandtia sp.]|jgi:mannose-6-phosphate isomerase-like protein (cupin superfamily)|uniref:cupin domain-containing protein n=1 Tax=Stackebrandtia sp. TaxID=2023065 RepID=UPI002D4DFC4A|nr:cupin domain-containing protein [Stackebrandtia sp.]HZE40524.1 cupin domain-containing protein [Stackebrandtia sp.]
MSYPEPKYFGADGEVTATYRPATDPPNLTMRNGGSAAYLATGASTDGKFGLYQWNMGPGRSGPDPHFHKTISESFYVTAGTVKIYNGTEWVDTKPGDFVYVPEGGIHGFRNESGEPASMLILFAPGAPREGYFEGLLTIGELSESEREEFFIEHDNYWL